MANKASDRVLPNGKKHDYFISYRDRDKNGNKEGTKAALLVLKMLKERHTGCNVYLNIQDDASPDFLNELENSENIIVLLEHFSFPVDESNGKNFKQEIERILDLKKKGILDANKVKLIKLGDFDTSKISDELFKKLTEWSYTPVYTGVGFENNLKHALFGDDREELLSKRKATELSLKKSRNSVKILTVSLVAAIVLAAIAIFLDHLPLSLDKRGFPHETESTSLVDSTSNKLVVFAGGGTVYNDLKENKKVDVNKLPGCIYLHMPSKQAWSMLWDENNNDTNQRYCLIVLSTTKMDVSEMTDTDSFKEEFRIVECKIGEVPLKVLVRPKLHDNFLFRKKSIRIDTLRKLIASNYTIYTTSKASGTFQRYNRILNNNGFNLSNHETKEFTQYSKEVIDSMLVLGNSVFKMSLTPRINNTIGTYSILDSTGKTINEELYVYTVASGSKRKGFKIDTLVMEYLGKIGLNVEKEYYKNDPLIVNGKKEK